MNEINMIDNLNQRIKDLEQKLATANEIIDELIEVTEVHLDDTFEKINKLRA